MNINAGILAALLTITLHYITFVQTNNGAEHDTITPPNTFLYLAVSLNWLARIISTISTITRRQRHFSKYLFSGGLHHSVELGIIDQTILVTVSLVNYHLNTHFSTFKFCTA